MLEVLEVLVSAVGRIAGFDELTMENVDSADAGETRDARTRVVLRVGSRLRWIWSHRLTPIPRAGAYRASTRRASATARSSASSAGTSMSGFTPTPSQLVFVIGLCARIFGMPSTNRSLNLTPST